MRFAPEFRVAVVEPGSIELGTILRSVGLNDAGEMIWLVKLDTGADAAVPESALREAEH